MVKTLTLDCLRGQVRILRLLRILGHNDETASDTMNDLLAQVQRSRSCTQIWRLLKEYQMNHNTEMKSGSRACSGGHQHRQHQDGRQRCPVRDRSHHPGHQIREWPQGERAAHPISGSNQCQDGGLNPFFVTSPQVLAVNILGRFLLNNDRNIRSVPPSLPSV